MTYTAANISAAYQEGWSNGWRAGIEAAKRCLIETGTIYGETVEYLTSQRAKDDLVAEEAAQ
jgi:hypothetical protein